MGPAGSDPAPNPRPPDRPAADRRVSSTLVVMVGILAGNLAGFGRELVTAAFLGASREADISLIAFAVPELFIVLLLTIVAPALVPALAGGRRLSRPPDTGGRGTADDGGRGTADDSRPEDSDFGRLVFALGLWSTAVLGAALLVLELLAPVLIGVLGAGLTAEESERALALLRLMLLGLAGLGLSATAIAALTTRRRFVGPALATAAYNLGFLLVVIGAYRWLGLTAFGWAVVIGIVAGLVLLIGFLRRADSRPRPALRHPGVARAFRFAAPVAAGYALHHLAFFADRAIGSFLPDGELAALNYAFRLALIVEQAIGIAVATVVLPALAEQVAGRQLAAARQTLGEALRLVAFLAWPAMGFVVLYATPLVTLIYQRGEFDQAAVRLTSQALIIFAGGLLADTLAQPVWRYFYATEAGGLVVWVNGGKTALRVLLNLLLVPLVGYLGIALSMSVGLTAQFALLTWLAARGLGGLGGPAFWPPLGRALAAGTVAVGVAWLVRQVADPAGGFWPLALGAIASGGAFLVAGRALGVPEVAIVLGLLRPRRRSRG